MATIISTQTGNFSAGATWVGGAAPVTDQDSVVVAAGHTVTGNTDFTFAAGTGLTITATGILNVDSTHALTFDADTENHIYGTLDFDTNAAFDGNWRRNGTIAVDGNIVFAAGMAWDDSSIVLTCDGAAGVHTITYNGSTAPAMVIDNNGTTSLTALDACAARSFTLTAGVYDGGDFAHDISGNIVISGGTFTTTGEWTQTASGNVSCNSHANRIAALVLGGAGVTSTLTGATRAKKFTHGAGTVTGGHDILVTAEADNAWVSGSGSVSVNNVRFYYFVGGSHSNGEIRIDANFELLVQNGETLTMTGPLDVGANTVKIGSSAAGTVSIDMVNQALTAGAISLGLSTIANKLGEIKGTGGVWKIASLQAARADANGNKAGLGSCHIELSGTMLGERDANMKIDFTVNGARINCNGTGRVSKCDCSSTGRLVVHSAVDGAGTPLRWWNEDSNTNVRFMGRREIGRRGIRAVA